MEIILVAVTALSSIACFVVGAKVGQKVTKGEDIKLPVQPKDTVRHEHDSKEAQIERERMDTILRNIDQYDGSAAHQEDVPRR